jgi:hypothetical protein
MMGSIEVARETRAEIVKVEICEKKEKKCEKKSSSVDLAMCSG